uniref:Uncharacterized protein n=1 Tax=Parascaris univalens TaxID=6257 RepID=A0A915BQZ9_PARUN
MSAEVTQSSNGALPVVSLPSHLCSSTLPDNDLETDSNSAYSGDEESEGEVPSGKKKRAFKHIAACTSDGNQLDNPLSTSSGRYFEFEMKANGLDGYFDESSESEDELGANEDNSFNFEMCRVRRNHRSPNSPPTMSQTGERTKTPDVKRPQLTPAKVAMKNEFVVDVENLDVEDALCVVHEGFAAVPSLAQEDDFDDLDI